jgi:hypothetical protein
MSAIRSLVFAFIIMCGFGVQLDATEYMTREQLETSSVDVLPGSVPVDYSRERDPENMAANAVSKIAGALSNHTNLTLGLVGGIGALGVLGVLSAPVAAIAAVAVGGLALAGNSVSNSRMHNPNFGRSGMNYGHYGMGAPPVYGANVGGTNRGIMDGVFGWTRGDKFNYQVGSIGVSSANRAPVHVNMDMPHVSNMYGRGYDYASGYSNAFMPRAAGSSPELNGPRSAMPSFGPNFNGYQQTYDRRGDQTFTNFFQRTDTVGAYNGERSTLGTDHQRMPWQPQVQYNWRDSMGRPDSALAQSWQSSGRDRFSVGAPQGQIPGQIFGAQNTNYGAPGNANFSGQTNVNPMPYYRPTPTMMYDPNAGMRYPMGNAYYSQMIPNNYNRTFTGYNNMPMNQGYSMNPYINRGVVNNYSLPAQQAPGVYQQVQTVQTKTIPQSNPMVIGAPVVTTYTRPVEIIPTSGGVATTQDVEEVQEQAEEQYEEVADNQAAALEGASAASSSSEKLRKLEKERKEVYSKLLKAIQSSDQENRKKYFDRYQEISKEILELKSGQ